MAGQVTLSELHPVSVREVKLAALLIRLENILGKHCCRINLGSGFSQSHQLHTDTSRSGLNLSDKLFIGSHPRGSDCCAHLWRAATVLLKSLQLALRVWVGC